MWWRMKTQRRRWLAVGLGAALVVLLAVGGLGGRSLLAPHRAAGGPINAALLHGSRDPQYRAPGGAVLTGQAIALRLRTAAGNVGQVKLRVWDTSAAGGHGDVVWYAAHVRSTRGGYDYWQVFIPAQRVFAFERYTGGEAAAVVPNADDAGQAHPVTLRVPGAPDGTRFVDAASGEQLVVSGGDAGGASGRRERAGVAACLGMMQREEPCGIGAARQPAHADR